jgi:hypothetical protein
MSSSNLVLYCQHLPTQEQVFVLIPKILVDIKVVDHECLAY